MYEEFFCMYVAIVLVINFLFSEVVVVVFVNSVIVISSPRFFSRTLC